MEAMEVDDKYTPLRQLLLEKCPRSTFSESDIKSLFDKGFESEADLNAANGEYLTRALPERPGKVAVLLKTFAQSEATTGPKVDKSRSWSEVMLLEELPELPGDEVGLRDILFPNVNGRLPVTEEVYSHFNQDYPEIVDGLLRRADGSDLCATVSSNLRKPFDVYSEMDVSLFVGGIIKDLFALLDRVSPHSFTTKVRFNKREYSGSSFSRTGSTQKTTRPDTLVMASDCLFLVGDDKALNLPDAEKDLKNKLMPLSPVFYGPVMFILGYMAAGTAFQWVYLSNNKELKRISPVLKLSLFEGRSLFLLSVGYAYKLIKKMADSVPTLPGRRAMYTLEINTERDRILDWAHDSVLKIIKRFPHYCEIFRGTSLEVIQEAYNVANGCEFLARATQVPKLTATTYSVRIAPLGCEVKLDSEQDGKKFAQNVCTALAALHRNGIVHRDVRLPNIVKVFESQTEYYFMVIDLETVAKADFKLPKGLDCFRFWTRETLEGRRYTPKSDMYHLGIVLEDAMKDIVKSPLAKSFIGDLISKRLDAKTALSHTWLSDSALVTVNCAGDQESNPPDAEELSHRKIRGAARISTGHDAKAKDLAGFVVEENSASG